MSRKLSKRQRQQVKQRNKEQQYKREKNLYKQGLTKKKQQRTLEPMGFYGLKISLAVLGVLIYFYYSSLMIVVALFYLAAVYAAVLVQRAVNKSYLRKNKLTILKFDSALGMGLIMITSLSNAFGLRSFGGAMPRFGRFGNTWYQQLLENIKNFGNLLTGQRSVFSRLTRFGMGVPPDMSNMPSPPSGAPQGGMGGMHRGMMSLENIPIEFLFSNLLSTVMSILFFTMIGVSLLGLGLMYLKIKKINQGDALIDLNQEINILNDEEIFIILDYGVKDDES